MKGATYKLFPMILSATIATILSGKPSAYAQAECRDFPCDLSILDRIDTSAQFGVPSVAQSGTKRGARKVFNYVLDTRATDLSMEGADVATDKESEFSSDTTAFYRDQLRRDSLHWQVVSLTARLAGEIGRDDTAAATTIGYLNSLRSLIGDNDTENLVRGLTGSKLDCEKSEMLRAQQLDISSILDLQESLLPTALDADQILGSVRHDLQPYNSATKGRRAATKVTYTGLQIAGFMPSIVAPLAQTTLFGVVMANGGSEQDKLLKELYYAKRFEKRQELIRKELSLVLEARQTAIATKNVTLFYFAKQLAYHMCRGPVPASLFPVNAVAQAKPAGI